MILSNERCHCTGLKYYGLYQYLIVNDDLLSAYDRLRAIYLGEQSTIDRMGWVAENLVKEAEQRPTG